MLALTQYGQRVSLAVLQSVLTSAHLFVQDGELVGYGYSSKKLDATKWTNGSHEKLLWEFTGAEEQKDIMGYYVTDATGQIVLSNTFDEPFKIGNHGDRIAVEIRLSLLASKEV